MTGTELLNAAIGRIESKSIREWASTPQNFPVFVKAAESWLAKRGDLSTDEDNVLRFSTWMVCLAMG